MTTDALAAQEGSERSLVLSSEVFYSDMATEYQRVLGFLDLPTSKPPTFEKHNQKLYEYLSADFGWG